VKNSTVTTVFSEDFLYGLCDMAMLGIISLLILLSLGFSLRNYCSQQVRFLKCTLQNCLLSNDILLWISKTQNCWETAFKLCIEWRKNHLRTLQLLVNHIQIVYWMRKQAFENLQLLINHIQIVYRMKEITIWELTIIDKSHSLMTLFKICELVKKTSKLTLVDLTKVPF